MVQLLPTRTRMNLVVTKHQSKSPEGERLSTPMASVKRYARACCSLQAKSCKKVTQLLLLRQIILAPSRKNSPHVIAQVGHTLHVQQKGLALGKDRVQQISYISCWAARAATSVLHVPSFHGVLSGVGTGLPRFWSSTFGPPV